MRLRLSLALWIAVPLFAVPLMPTVCGELLRAGVGRADITDYDAGPVHDPSFVKALVLQQAGTTVVLVTVDAVAIGEIGRIDNDYLSLVRGTVRQDFGIPASHVIVNASHCHSVIRSDIAALTVQAIRDARQSLIPVTVGVGTTTEDRISENRRLRMKDGSEVDMRRAYALPPGEDVAAVGPIDPEVGLLRLDRSDGTPLAVVYHFACHPIMGAPDGGNTAGFPGVASRTIEDAFGGGTTAFFIQGCAGDINPIRYKSVSEPHDGAPAGHRLGHTVVRALHEIAAEPTDVLRLASRTLALPRAADLEQRIAAVESKQMTLLRSLRPTDISFRTFVPLLIQQRLWPESPSYYAQGYLHDAAQNRDHLEQLDATNRRNVDAYLENIHTMEELTRLNVNLALLRRHRARQRAQDQSVVEAEVTALRIGDFHLVTFPGELTVDIGLQFKRQALAPHTFVAGYTNGYLYYTPTRVQRQNSGYAQEDCDCLVAPEWQALFETAARELLDEL